MAHAAAAGGMSQTWLLPAVIAAMSLPLPAVAVDAAHAPSVQPPAAAVGDYAAGGADGRFSPPRGVEMHDDGTTVVVVDTGNRRIRVVAPPAAHRKRRVARRRRRAVHAAGGHRHEFGQRDRGRRHRQPPRPCLLGRLHIVFHSRLKRHRRSTAAAGTGSGRRRRRCRRPPAQSASAMRRLARP